MKKGYRTTTRTTDPQIGIRFPKDMKIALEQSARENHRSFNAEVLVYCNLVLSNKVRVNALNQVFLGDESD